MGRLVVTSRLSTPHLGWDHSLWYDLESTEVLTVYLSGQGRSTAGLSSALPSPTISHLVDVSDWLILSCSSSARNPRCGALSSCRSFWPPGDQLWGDEERNAVVLVGEGAWWPKWAEVHMLRAAGVQKRKKCLSNNIVEIPPCICSLCFLHLCSYHS